MKLNAWSILAILLSTGIAVADERVVYTRAEVVTSATGTAEFRRAYTSRIELPGVHCEGGMYTCTEDRIYSQVYAVSFFKETTTRETDGSPASELLDRGRLMLAVEFPPEVRQNFEEALEARLESIAIAAYARPQAGLRYLDEPLENQRLWQSTAPVWVCRELDGKYHFDLLVDRGRTRTSYSGADETAERACRAIEAAVEQVEVKVFRTLPEIGTQVRREVRLSTASSLSGRTWLDALAPLPDGVVFEKAPLDGRKTGASRDRRDGVYRGHEGRYGEAERDVRLPAASLDLIGAPMWVSRWTFEATRESFGEDPQSVDVPSETLFVAVVPVQDPLMLEFDRGRTMLHVPHEKLVAKAISQFTWNTSLSPELVIQAFADPEIWPSIGDWMIVSCRDDDSARYGIAPFAGAAVVSNPLEACAEIRSQIEG